MARLIGGNVPYARWYRAPDAYSCMSSSVCVVRLKSLQPARLQSFSLLYAHLIATSRQQLCLMHGMLEMISVSCNGDLVQNRKAAGPDIIGLRVAVKASHKLL